MQLHSCNTQRIGGAFTLNEPALSQIDYQLFGQP
jgi:hypothetical protein